MAEDGYKVILNVYDLSQGLARQLSTTFLGKAIEGIWHTGVVVYGKEYYFGGRIQVAPAGSTPYGAPLRVVDLGVTHVPQDVFEQYLQEISPRFTAETYSLLSHNCNNFSNEVVQFLVGTGIPDYILQLPNEVLSSPMGAMIMPMIQNLESTLRAGAVPQVPQFRPAAVTQPSIPTASISLNRRTSGSAPVSANKPTPSSVKTEQPATNGTAAPKRAPANNTPVKDPLGDARSKIQDEIAREFAALMASGSMSASEAASLATKKVMQKYGHLKKATA